MRRPLYHSEAIPPAKDGGGSAEHASKEERLLLFCRAARRDLLPSLTFPRKTIDNFAGGAYNK